MNSENFNKSGGYNSLVLPVGWLELGALVVWNRERWLVGHSHGWNWERWLVGTASVGWLDTAMNVFLFSGCSLIQKAINQKNKFIKQ